MEGKCKLVDVEARTQIMALSTRIDTNNERTKRQTLQIQDLQKEVKELKK